MTTCNALRSWTCSALIPDDFLSLSFFTVRFRFVLREWENKARGETYGKKNGEIIMTELKFNKLQFSASPSWEN